MLKKTIAVIGLCFLVSMAAGCAIVIPTDPYNIADSSLPGLYEETGIAQSEVATDVYEKKEPEKTTEKAPSEKTSLTLSEIIKTALENNPELAATTHEAEIASARHAQSLARALPSLSATGSYVHDKDDQRLFPSHYNGEPGVYGDDIYSAGVVLTQPLFAGGRLIKEISATECLSRAARHRLSRTKKELVFNVKSTFYAILAQKKVVDSLAFSKKTIEEHLKRVNSLIEQGKAAKVDRLRTEVRLAEIVEQLTRAENILLVQTRLLANLMGVSVLSPADITGDLAYEQADPIDLPDSIRRAFERRDDYQAARAELEAAAAKVDAARAEHWPSVTLEGEYGARWAHDPAVLPKGSDRSDEMAHVGVFVNLPIFESGRIAAKVREQEAILAAARERLKGLELAIRLDVETAAADIESAQKRIEATKKAVDQSRETLRIEQKKYELGKGSITDVLDAQSAMLTAQTSHYRAMADFNTAVARMRLATGEMK